MNTYENELTLYEQFEKDSKSKYELRCIDGQITGCSNCVGYCKYEGHPGFLTSKQRSEHDCINKKCYHYIAKERNKQHFRKEINFGNKLIDFAQEYTICYEGMKFLRAESKSGNKWLLRYITITNDYPIADIERELCIETGFNIKLERLNYNFDMCAKLIFS